jgi:hypothetical protein
MVTLVRRAAVLALVLAAFASIQVWAATPPVIKVMIHDDTSQQRTAAKVDELVNPYSDYILAKTGVRVALDWQAGEDTDYNEKVTLALASGNAPDLIFMGGNDQFAMNIVRSGALEPLNASFGKYPNLNKVYNDEYWKTYSFNNQKLVLKGVNVNPLAVRAILIRQDWLTKLNLKMPTTVPALYDVAKKFVAAKLDGQPVNGLTGRQNFSYFFALSSAYGCPSPDVENGYTFIDKAKQKLVFWNTTDAARAYFKETLRWYKEGLIDPELMTSGGSFWSKIDAGRIGIICHNSESVGWLTTEIRQAQKTKTPTLAVVPALRGTGFRNQFGKEGGFEENFAFEGYWGIPRGNRNVDSVLKVLDFESTKEFADYRVFGLEGTERKTVNGKPTFDKARADLVGFWKDYAFITDRTALSADARQAILVDMSGGGDTANDFLYDTPEEAIARTQAGWDASAAQAVPRISFDAIVPKLPVESQYPDVIAPYRTLYVKLITGEWDASKDADWRAYLKAVDDIGITAILKAKEEYLVKNAPQMFK